MKLLDLIAEDRRNPHRNDEKMGHVGAVEFLTTLPELANYGVTLTSVNKLGLNPHSEYNTPLAICFYPAAYYLKQKSSGYSMEFVDDAPYIQIIKLSGNVVNLSDNSLDIFSKGVSLLKANASTIAKLLRLNESSVIQNIDISLKFANRQASVKSEAGMFWYVLYNLAKVANSREDVDHGKREYGEIVGLMPLAWNKIMRIIGIDVVIDSGKGILHKNEPFQGMAFNPTAVTAVKVFPRTKSNIEKGTEIPPLKILATITTGNAAYYVRKVLSFINKYQLNYSDYTSYAIRTSRRLIECFQEKPELIRTVSYKQLQVMISLCSRTDPIDANILLRLWVYTNWKNGMFEKLEQTIESYTNDGQPIPAAVMSQLYAQYGPFIELRKERSPVIKDEQIASEIDAAEQLLASADTQ